MLFQVICLKSFGDFVIATGALRRIDLRGTSEKPGLVAGTHLQALAEAIGTASSMCFVGDPGQIHVPAAYDVRRLGVPAALRSLISLRRHLGPGRADDIRLFDRVGWREQLLAGRTRAEGLPVARNIYFAYSRYFESQGHALLPRPLLQQRAGSKALVVPASRIARKALPGLVIASALSQLRSQGFDAHVLVLDGEQVQLPAGASVSHRPRNFSSLIEAVRDADLVVSADSLPAHLAEFFGIPTFVFTPQSNEYWLPETAYASGGWCMFDDGNTLTRWLSSHPAFG